MLDPHETVPQFAPMEVRQVRIPQGTGWFTFARGAIIKRRTALRILICGSMRGRIETVQSNDPEKWR